MLLKLEALPEGNGGDREGREKGEEGDGRRLPLKGNERNG